MVHWDIGPLRSITVSVMRIVGCLAGPGSGWGSRVGRYDSWAHQPIAGLGKRTSLRCPNWAQSPQQLWRTTFLPQSFFGQTSSSILE